MKVYKTHNAKVYLGNCIDVLKRLPERSVQMCVTSPPYWGLRDYGNDKTLEVGAESTPEQFVAKMVEVFREVRRVLRDDGTCWINLGDTYGSPPGRKYHDANAAIKQQSNGRKNTADGNLVGIPWRVALALQADGWILRQDIIWHKPSPMPESVKNRCTKAHEYIFLLTKRMGYYYDADAIKEKLIGVPHAPGNVELDASRNDHDQMQKVWGGDGFHNKRSVWTVSSQGYSDAHFATYPPKLILPCILAGTSAKGCCTQCGTPWKRVTKDRKLKRDRPNDKVKRTGEKGTGNSCGNTVAGVETQTVGWTPGCECNGKFVKRKVNTTATVKFHGGSKGSGGNRNDDGRGPGEEEREETVLEYVSDLPIDEHPRKPCTVLDPFSGSGTTGMVAIKRGRKYIGIDLNEKYIQMSLKRLRKGESQRGFGVEG